MSYLDGVDEVLSISLKFPLALIQLVWTGGYDTSGTN